jgi:heterotetrameric sarcosine oxidase delta subunit
MLLIPCPWCGPRGEEEFAYGGEDGILRPDPARADDTVWADYLHARTNLRGPFRELWQHRHGCAQWFWAERDTATSAIAATGLLGGNAP